MPRNSNNFQHIEENATFFYRQFSHTYTIKFSSRLDKNCSSFAVSLAERCSFEKNVFQVLKSAYLLSEVFDVKGFNLKRNISRYQIFCTLFVNT